MSNEPAEAIVSRMVGRWNLAAERLDPARLAALYAPDAVFLGGMADQYVGRTAISGYFADYVDSLAGMTLVLAETSIVTPAAGCVVVQGFGDFAFRHTDARQTSARLRVTLGFSRSQGETWTIFLHHVSPSPTLSPVAGHPMTRSSADGT